MTFLLALRSLVRSAMALLTTAQYSGKFQMILAQPRLDLKLSAPDFMLLHLASHGCRPDDMNFVKVLLYKHYTQACLGKELSLSD